MSDQRTIEHRAVGDPSEAGEDIDQLCVNAIRTLSMDAVQQANSGHPGTPMAPAPLQALQQKFGFTVDNIIAAARQQIEEAR